MRPQGGYPLETRFSSAKGTPCTVLGTRLTFSGRPRSPPLRQLAVLPAGPPRAAADSARAPLARASPRGHRAAGASSALSRPAAGGAPATCAPRCPQRPEERRVTDTLSDPMPEARQPGSAPRLRRGGLPGRFRGSRRVLTGPRR